jgi:cytochrome c biogenesis protein CcmG/thiol:disulfide interchange protein DsbE
MAIAIPIIALLGFGLTRDPREIPSPLPGRPAPAFALPVMRAGDVVRPPQVGDTVRLGEHAGDVVVVNFWASWCLACRDEHRVLSEVAARYAGTDAHFYGVLYQDSPANGREWIAEMGGQSYPSLDDPRSRTAINFGLYGVPETFFIGRDGRVAFKQVGPVTEALLTSKVDSLLALPAAGGRSVPADSAVRADSARSWPLPVRESGS